MPLTLEDRHALTHWGLHNGVSARRASSGASNRIFLLETGLGTLVLRAYRPRSQERVHWEHKIIQYAVECGIPTPAPILSNQGQPYLELGEQRYALFPYIADEQIERENISCIEAHSMGAFLGELDTRLRGVPSSEAPHHKLVAFEPGDRESALTAVEELLRLIRALPQSGMDEQWSLAYLEAQHRWLTFQLQSQAVYPERNYRLTLIHGDFQESNLFFSTGRVSAIIDWERARMAPWGWDVVRALDLVFGLNPVLCRVFLEGYKTCAPVDENELAFTAALYGEERDRNSWVFRAIYLEGNERVRRFLRPDGFRPFKEKWAELFPNHSL